MGRITSTTGHASKYLKILKHPPKVMLMDRPQRRPLFQLALIGTPWRGDPNVRTPRQNENLGRE